MNPLTLGALGLAIVSYIGGALLPTARTELFSIATGLVTWVMPHPQTMVDFLRGGAPEK